MTPYELFEVLAQKTWRSIERFSRNRIHLGEDAITSLNLDALASARPAFVFAEDTRTDESTKGCDFEIWIGSDGNGWRRYAVQAKKLHFNSGRYASLGHEVGGKQQIDILESYAKANRALPIYCFYNHSSRPYRWNCSLPDTPEQLGCSVAPISVIRRALARRGGKNFRFIHSQIETLPWRCLVRCDEFTRVPPKLGPTPPPGSYTKVPIETNPHHKGWPNPLDYYHEDLPAPLHMLRERGDLASFEDQPDLFNPNIAVRPRWIGVIELDGRHKEG